MEKTVSKYNALLYVAGLLFIVWGILGLMDAENYVMSGYQLDDDNVIVSVEPGSPAEAAGMQVGDLMLTSGGIDINNNKALRERERPSAGESREFVVSRDDTEMALNMTYGPMSEKEKMLNTLGFVIGLLFILIGLYTFRKHKSDISLGFAVFSICFGFIFMDGPYLGTGMLSSLINVLGLMIVIYSFYALARYMLKYPQESTYNRNLLILPGALLVLIILFLEMTQPDGNSTLNMAVRLFFFAVIVFYFVTALITLIRKYNRTPKSDRNASGMNMMLIGSLVGLIPILIYFTLGTLSPGIDLPGNDYVFITFLAIPIFFMMALNQYTRHHQST